MGDLYLLLVMMDRLRGEGLCQVPFLPADRDSLA